MCEMKIKTKKTLMFFSMMFSLFVIAGSCKKEDALLTEIPVRPDVVQLDSVNNSQKDTLVQSSPADTVLQDSAIYTEKDSLTTPPQLEPEQNIPPAGSTAYKLENILPEGYVKDGSKDYTNYIQYAINNYTEVVFPSFPLLVSDEGIKVPSNRTLYFNKGSEIRLKPSSKGNYDVFRIENVKNITFVNPVIIGDRYKHIGTSGEWGHGIGIYGSENITISGAKISDCWGDGIYIAGSRQAHVSRNIKITMVESTGNRRHGMSVISVDGLELYRPYLANSSYGGNYPSCGIDFEPDSYNDELKNILITGIITENNDGPGIQIGLTRMYGMNNKSVDIIIKDHMDTGSEFGLKVACRTSKRKAQETMNGTLKVINPNWRKNTDAPLYAFSADPNFTIAIHNPKLMDSLGSYLTPAQVKTILEGTRSIWKPTIYTLTF